ncbi:MAG: hypothetical protein ACK553_08865 [Planctomycetota bacterium]|jgi:hypothetical protein
MNVSQAESIRKAFRDFVRRRSGVELSSTMLETTLIRNGSYCGRRFSVMGFSLIWFIDEQQIKLYGQDGGLIQSMTSREFCDRGLAPAAMQEFRRAA